MKRFALLLVVLLLFTMACDLTANVQGTPGAGGLPDPSGNNNPGSLNTPNPNDPGQDINTALPPTQPAPGVVITPPGSSGGPGTPTVPTLNDVTPSGFTPTPSQ